MRTSQMNDQEFLDYIQTHPASGGDGTADLSAGPMAGSPDTSATPSPDPLSGPSVSDLAQAGAQPPAQAQPPQQAQPTYTPAALPPQAPQPAQPGMWRGILEGVLNGIASVPSHGRSSFLGGVTGGARAAVEMQQQARENDQKQQQLNNQNAEVKSNIQFQNLRAAQSVAEESRKIQEFHNLDKEQQIAIAQKTAEHDVYMQDQGLQPDMSTADTSDAAHGTMKTLSDMNGGTVPEVSANHNPVKGTVSIYAPTASDDSATKAAQLNFINKGRAVQGLPAITQDAIRRPADRAAAFHNAFETTNPVPTDVTPSNVVTMLNNTQQQRDRWAKSNPDDTSTLKQLDNRIASLKQSQKTFQTSTAQGDAMKSSAEETARLNAKNANDNAQAAQAQAGLSRFGVAKTDTPEQIQAKLPPTVAADIKGLLNYEISPSRFPSRLPSGKGGGQGQVDQQTAIGLAKMIDPTYDDTQYNERNKMRLDYTSGKPGTTGGNVRAINTAVHHLDELNQSQAKLASFGFDSANYVKNKLTPGFLRATAQVPTESDINAVTSEVANVFAGKGATQPELDTWKKGISINSTHAEFESWIKEGMNLMAGRAAAIKGGWEAGMGKPYDFGLIYPATRDALKTIPGGDALANSLGITKGGATPPSSNLTSGASAYLQNLNPNHPQ